VSAPTVNLGLTSKPLMGTGAGGRARRRRDVVENDDYAAFARRIIVAHGRRIGHGDIEGLADLAALAEEIDTALRHAVTGLREAGFSWADIATRLDISRQAAHQRFGDNR
jgi:DNA-directed RNA polymerase specialized sigma24 family protein